MWKAGVCPRGQEENARILRDGFVEQFDDRCYGALEDDTFREMAVTKLEGD